MQEAASSTSSPVPTQAANPSLNNPPPPGVNQPPESAYPHPPHPPHYPVS